MKVSEALRARRSIKHFDPEHRMTEQEISQLLSSTVLSPTAFNIQHWRFVVVDDAEQRKTMRDLSWGQPQVTDASIMIVMCMDLKAWDKSPERYWVNTDQDVQDFMVNNIRGFYNNNDQSQYDEGMRSTGLAAMSIMLMAQEMGYDSCAMDGFDFTKVGELINLPEDHAISMMIAVGKKIEDAHPRAGQLPLEEVWIRNKF